MSFFLPKTKSKDRVYLDYAAATPLRREVFDAMLPYMCNQFANASAIYAEGRGARAAISAARAQVAQILRIRKDEVFFVSGGTEANNLAIIGIVEAIHKTGRAYDDCEILTTALEHPSILGAVDALAQRGVVVRRIPVDGEGLVDYGAFEATLSPKTVLVTCAYVNSEIGVVQDVKRLTRIVKKFRLQHAQTVPYVHLDASQAPLFLPCALDSLGVDCMTLDAGKFCGPKGSGVLAKKQTVPLTPLFFGGDQEEGARPGTEHTASIVGFAKAFSFAQNECAVCAARVTLVREYAIGQLLSIIPGTILNGSATERIANNINISIPGIDGEYAAVVLDHHGFAVSTKSACSGASGSGSKVIYALGGDDARALSTLRITLGEHTTKRNIDTLVCVLEKHVRVTRSILDQLNKK